MTPTPAQIEAAKKEYLNRCGHYKPPSDETFAAIISAAAAVGEDIEDCDGDLVEIEQIAESRDNIAAAEVGLLQKRPICWCVKAANGDWILYDDEKVAREFADSTNVDYHGLYLRAEVGEPEPKYVSTELAAIGTMAAVAAERERCAQVSHKFSESDLHDIGHAKYQVERASPENPDVCFDYTLVANLLTIIERLSAAAEVGEFDRRYEPRHYKTLNEEAKYWDQMTPTAAEVTYKAVDIIRDTAIAATIERCAQELEAAYAVCDTLSLLHGAARLRALKDKK